MDCSRRDSFSLRIYTHLQVLILCNCFEATTVAFWLWSWKEKNWLVIQGFGVEFQFCLSPVARELCNRGKKKPKDTRKHLRFFLNLWLLAIAACENFIPVFLERVVFITYSDMYLYWGDYVQKAAARGSTPTIDWLSSGSSMFFHDTSAPLSNRPAVC